MLKIAQFVRIIDLASSPIFLGPKRERSPARDKTPSFSEPGSVTGPSVTQVTRGAPRAAQWESTFKRSQRSSSMRFVSSSQNLRGI